MSKSFRGENLVGKQFGEWIVLEFVPNNKEGAHWLCKCNCNIKTQKTVLGSSLKNGTSKSCGKCKIKNLLGETFGRLSVIEQMSNRHKNGSIMWKCQCSCENKTELEVTSSHLINGNTQSCGCLRKETLSKMSSNDLSDQIFGRLTAIEATNKRDNSGNIIWKCICSCENKIIEISRRSLIEDNTKSCGCLAREAAIKNAKDLLGKSFGNLIVIEKTDKRRNRRVVWKCQCNCPAKTIVEISSDILLKGRATSCGCTSSMGNVNIRTILKENNIDFIPEYSFNNLRSKKDALLKFDFAVMENDNLCYLIEFDGPQHEQYTPRFHKTYNDFLESKERDELKNEYCLNNNIPLIRIPYKERDNINFEILQFETTPYLYKKLD